VAFLERQKARGNQGGFASCVWDVFTLLTGCGFLGLPTPQAPWKPSKASKSPQTIKKRPGGIL
jgi:hypothetical protein